MLPHITEAFIVFGYFFDQIFKILAISITQALKPIHPF